MYKNLQQIFNKVDEDTLVSQYRFVPALFYCGWVEDEEQRKITQECHPYCCFNHYVGLPTIKFTDAEGQSWESEPIELHDYQKRWITKSLENPYYALVKCRGAGGTEILGIRWPLYQAITNMIKDRKWLLVAGTNLLLSKDVLSRMKRLIDRRPSMYRKRPTGDTPVHLEIGNSKIFALASDEESVTGYENVGGIILDESAKWDLINDQPVLDAAEPHVAKSGARITVLSTPKKRRGFFWTKIFNPEVKTKYYRDKTNWEEACNVDKPLIDRKLVEKEKIDDPEYYAQEYNCEFVVPSDSLFGKLEEKNISNEFKPIIL